MFESILEVADRIDCQIPKRTYDSNLTNISSLCFFNSTHNFHAIRYLLKSKYYNQAGLILRHSLETAFVLDGLSQNPSKMIQILENDKEYSIRSVKKFMENRDLLSEPDRIKFYSNLIEELDVKFRPLNVASISQSGRIGDLYLIYKLLCSDYSHVTMDSIFSALDFMKIERALMKFNVLMYFACVTLVFSCRVYAEINSNYELIQSLKDFEKRLVEIKVKTETPN